MLAAKLALAVLLTLLAGFFAALKTALFSLTETHWQRLRASGLRRLDRIERLAEDHRGLRLSLQIGKTLAALGAAAVGLSAARQGFPHLPAAVAGALSIAAITPALLLFGEFIPQARALQSPEGTVRRYALPLLLALRAIAPLAWAVRRTSDFLTLRIAGELPEQAHLTRADTLRGLVALESLRSEQSEALEATERELIDNVYAFGDAVVREVMTPRSKMAALSAAASAEEVIAFFRDHQYSRVPVYDGSPDHIVGVLFMKDLLRLAPPYPSLKELARPAYVVPETKSAEELFQDLRERKSHIAIVVDEFGDVSGLVTLEDLLEELFGEIYDEYDEREALWSPGEIEGTFRVAGALPVWEFNEIAGAKMPEGIADTVGGLVFHARGS
ncbi:MAG: hemolysin family protein, partial [Candidatus Methylomirabilis sp.]|nr:hemolysin family protein [Deltaproteobacteria bacterium]